MKRMMVAGAILGVLGLTAVGGVALAQSADPSPTPSVTVKAEREKFAARLAEKLGVSEEAVKDAVAAVRRDVQDEHVSAMLDKLVAAGKLTQEQADEYEAWWKERPDGPLPLPGMHRPDRPFIAGGHGPAKGHGPARPFFTEDEMRHLPPPVLPPLGKLGAIPIEKVEGLLDRMVEEGRLTREQADEYLAWWKAR